MPVIDCVDQLARGSKLLNITHCHPAKVMHADHKRTLVGVCVVIWQVPSPQFFLATELILLQFVRKGAHFPPGVNSILNVRAVIDC